jgi:peptidoglycan/xylan/chitin deacetylase (PgdA/CDA1 family)
VDRELRSAFASTVAGVMTEITRRTVGLADLLGRREQSGFGHDVPWPKGKRAGLSLTFDDARTSQVDRGTPVLDRYAIKATFYALPSMLRHRPRGWEEAVAAGHELGNHTVSHPCSCNFPFSRENALEDYTLERLEQELIQANEALEVFAGRRPTSFAYPCGQRFVGRGKTTRSYVPLVAEHFLVGRGFLDETPNDPLRCDMAQVSGVAADGKGFEQLREAIDSAFEEGRWLVLVAHDIASELRPQAMTTDVLEEVCRHASRLPELWTDTVSAIGSHLLQKRGG